MISVDKAREIILSEVSPLKGIEACPLTSCLDRISAIDIRSKENIPSFNNSAMDGFAIRAGSPKILEVIENLPAGYTAKKTIKPDQAIRIMTGAPLPKGADAVVMVENTKPVASRQSPVTRKG